MADGGRARGGFARSVLREPLLHFLVLGGLIFVANWALHPTVEADNSRISVTRADIDRIAALYTQQWGGAPTKADMPNLLDNYIRSETLFREGTRLGLGAEDSVMRNRVIQKMEFLLQDASAIVQPTDAEMAAYLASHAADFEIPERLVFAQIFFSAAIRADRAESDAGEALKRLPPSASDTGQIGDPFMLSQSGAPQTREAVAQDYGDSFADAVFAMPAPVGEGAWQGPIRSALGFHLVRILRHDRSRMPDLSEIRDRVHDVIMAERFQAAFDFAYDKIRAKYQVTVDNGALAAPASRVVSASPK